MNELNRTLLDQLVKSRQRVDQLEKEVDAKRKENLLIKNHLQELTDFGEGLVVRMPEDWSLEEQNTALRLKMLSMSLGEYSTLVEENSKELHLNGKKHENLFREVMQENEAYCKELKKYNEKKADYEHVIKEALKVSFHADADVKNVLSAPDLESSRECTIGSKAEESSRNCGTLKNEEGVKLHEMTDEEFCDLQIRLLEAGHEMSKQELQAVEDMFEKTCISDNHAPVKASDRNLEVTEKVEPCKVDLLGLGWGGPSPAAIMRHVRMYDGVTNVSVDGDIASVYFKNVALASRFRKDGSPHNIDGIVVNVGEILLEKTAVVSSENSIETNVRVKVKRRIKHAL